MVLGVDFGASVTDAVAMSVDPRATKSAKVLAEAALSRPGPASLGVLESVLGELRERLASRGSPAPEPRETCIIGVTGGRARELPERHGALELIQVSEPEAVLRGGLHLAGLDEGMVVSCGSGTAVVLGESSGPGRHVTGTPVGGGTLHAFARLLFEGSDADAVAELALRGDAAAVDTTLADVLGGSLGELPADATAVSLGRIGSGTGPLEQRPRPVDLAAGLCTMVAQTVALIALNAALAHGSPRLVFVGRLAGYEYLAAMIAAVLRVYRYPHEAVFPTGGQKATAIGAALAAVAASEARTGALRR